jgi:hypothetical protein
MNDVREVLVTGNAFSRIVADIGVPAADQVSATAMAAEPSLPDHRMGLLTEPWAVPKTAAEKQEHSSLLGDRWTLNKRVDGYLKRKWTAHLAGLEESLEQAKRDVLAQDDLLAKLNEKFVADQKGWVLARNILIMAQGEEHAEEQSLKSMSPFCSRKDREAAEKCLESAKAKREKAEREAAQLHQALNYLQMETIRVARGKRELLIDAVKEANALVNGRDPDLARFGFQQT